MKLLKKFLILNILNNIFYKNTLLFMAQLDKELFIEYIFYIFLILLHFYTTFFINKTVIYLKARLFYLNNFYKEIRSMHVQQSLVKTIHENFNSNLSFK
jgi:hypothetical protein